MRVVNWCTAEKCIASGTYKGCVLTASSFGSWTAFQLVVVVALKKTTTRWG